MRGRLLIVLAVAGVAAIACNAAAYTTGPHTALVLASIGWTLAGFSAVAGLLAGLPRTATDFRRAWSMLLVGSVLWLLGQLVWDGYLVAGETPPIPSAGDVGWLLFAVFAAAGVYRIARPSGIVRYIVRLDTLAIVTATAALLFATLHNELMDSHGSTILKATALAYPLFYCTFVALLLESIGRHPAVLRLPGVAFILAGAVLEAAGFALWSPQLFEGSYVAGRSVADVLWTLGCLGIGAGGFLAATRNLSVRPREQALRHRSPMPAVAFALLVATQIVAALRGWPQQDQMALRAALLVVGLALFFRAWTMSRLWAQTYERERRARRALEVSNRELESFSYSASHDLKAPLVSIQGFAGSLRRRAGDQLDERSTLYLDRIESNAHALQELIDELLTFARLGGDGTGSDAVDADSIARDVVRGFRERHGGTGANVELVSQLPPVQVHPTRLRQALTNLIENAVTHSGDSAPRVQVGSYVANGHVAIFVEDDGRGIAEADRERIFDLFSHSGATATASSRSGIGLAVVKKIAETSGGSITYEPGVEGGSRFVLSLPRGASC